MNNFGTISTDSKHIGNSTSDMLLITHNVNYIIWGRQNSFGFVLPFCPVHYVLHLQAHTLHISITLYTGFLSFPLYLSWCLPGHLPFSSSHALPPSSSHDVCIFGSLFLHKPLPVSLQIFSPSHLSASTLRSVPARIMTCQCIRSSAISVVISLLDISSFTRSRHFRFGLPRFRFPSIVICKIFLVASSLSRLCTCPNHLDFFYLRNSTDLI